MTRLDLEVAEPFHDLFEAKRYKIYYGGRGGAKSWAFARALVAMAYTQPLRILCCREFQNSMVDSSHKIISDQIERLGLSAAFDITEKSIKTIAGSEFIFKGLARNAASVKSMEGVDIAWVEEAQTISRPSLDLLIPTIRKEGSELWFSYNPEHEDDPIEALRKRVQHRKNATVKKVGWQDNPWFPKVLNEERLSLREADPSAYEHVWEGAFKRISDAVIFNGKYEEHAFETPQGDVTFHYGADWGFSQDPTALIRCFEGGDGCLYIDYEAFGHRVDFSDLPALFDQVPGARTHLIYADSARPDTISYMRKEHGFNIRGVDKRSGEIRPGEKSKSSIEDGIAYLRGYRKIIIHPRCKNIMREFRLYSYEVDRRDPSIIFSTPRDAHNHGIDGLRYALSEQIRSRGFKPYTDEDLFEIETGIGFY